MKCYKCESADVKAVKQNVEHSEYDFVCPRCGLLGTTSGKFVSEEKAPLLYEAYVKNEMRQIPTPWVLLAVEA